MNTSGWTHTKTKAHVLSAPDLVQPEDMEEVQVWHYSIPNVQQYDDGQLEGGHTIFSTKNLVNQETLLVSKLNPRKATVVLAKPKKNLLTVASTEFVQLVPTTVDAKFLYYLYNSKKTTEYLSAIVQSATRSHQRVNPRDILDLDWQCPPLPTQKAIARYLDERTARIDALIAKKQRLLSLLAERRAALITRAVTRGLDERVKLKDSGVEWLGEIPVGWEVKRLKDVSRIRYGLGEPPPKLDDGVPFIRATDIYRGTVDMSKTQTVDPEQVPWHRRPKLESDEILVVRSGAYTGDSAIITPEVADTGAVAGYDMVVTVEAADPKYVAYSLLSKSVLQNQIYLMRNRAAQPHLNAEELGSVVMVFPPDELQKNIVSELDRKSEKYMQGQDRISDSLTHLQEYRSALITAAVNGEVELPVA